MSLSSLFDGLAARWPRRRRKKGPPSSRRLAECLEPRTLLTSNAALPAIDNGSSASGPSDHQKFVNQAYLDLLGRAPDAGGLAYWVAQLNSGARQGQIANALTHSAEYCSTMVKPAYQSYLGRLPDSGGLAYWISQMQSGMTDERLEADLIGSKEFYVHAGGSDVKWVDALYNDLLGRIPDSQGEAYWTGQLAAGVSRTTVAYGFAASLERGQQRVGAEYLHYLGRLADQQGVDYWVQQFAHGLTNDDLIAELVGSSEYFERATSSDTVASPIPAMLLLDASSQASLDVTGNAAIAINHGSIVINSAAARAAVATGNTYISAAELDVHGSPGVSTKIGRAHV